MNEKVKKIVVIAIISLVVIIVGILIYMNIDIKKVDNTNQNNEIVPAEEITDEQLRETTINLYFINQNNEIAEEMRKIDSKILLQNPYLEVMNLLLSGPKADCFKTYMPKDVKVNNITKEKDCLIIDFSKEFIENEEENVDIQSLTISQIVNTMTQFTEINSVKITVEGEENLSFKNGNIKFDRIFTDED